jgi:hypothetical protein
VVLKLARPPVISVGVPIVALALMLAMEAATSTHPHLTRQSVIDAALKGYEHQTFPRVAAKLMHRGDLQRADPGWRGRDPSELIWVIAVSGNYGIAPSFACCSVPSDYPGYNTWGLAIFVDAVAPLTANEFEVSYHGSWPPFFDELPDLAAH